MINTIFNNSTSLFLARAKGSSYISRLVCIPIILLFLNMRSLAMPCNLNCSGHLNISLDENCQRIIVPDDVLENPGACTYSIILSYPFGTNQLSNGAVDRSHLGYTFIYKATDQTSRNSCWGYVTIEDKLPPLPLCKNNLRISCFQLVEYSEIVNQPQDNCAQEGTAVISALSWKDYNCDSAIIGRVYRSITSFDIWGNTSTCNDTLLIRKDHISDVKCTNNVSLNCRVLCRKPDATGLITDRKNYEMITFSSEKNNKFYPTPELLLRLQMTDTFSNNFRTCITRDSLLVPAVRDTLLVAVARNTPFPSNSSLSGLAAKDTCVYVDSCVTMWTKNGMRKGGLCKLSLEYYDLITYLCGNGFKIRREWRIVDWCTGAEVKCVQYIKVQDGEMPIVADTLKYYSALVKPHDCISQVNVKALIVDDCDETIKQDYFISYTDDATQKTIVLKGTLPTTVNLPATGAIYGRRCFRVYVDLSDRCFNRTRDSIEICVTDNTAPTPLCNENTQAVVDPATCWARVYAKDLDNGSRDNCCNVLHFAIARMTEIESVRTAAVSKIEKNCGSAEYWNKKLFYDAYIENYINCYVFKDYLDLSECGRQQVVLRVYEACGVPLYDSHIFLCSPHDWYCYNTSHLFRAEFNFNWLDKHDTWYKEGKARDCTWRPRILCKDSLSNWLTYLHSKDYDSKEIFVGSFNLNAFADYNSIFEFSKDCLDLSYETAFTSTIQSIYAYPPGNTCSKYLYNECMVIVDVVDKTPPACDRPQDVYIYCDGVVGDPKNANAHLLNCTNGKVDGAWPNQIECIKENDGNLTDAIDPTGKYYGYYGGPVQVYSHDDHNQLVDAICANNAWAPIYCKAWLCLDSSDTGGKVDFKSYFSKPVAASGGRPSVSAGIGKFWIYDNCKLNDTIPFTDDTQVDKCGKGWIKRTWTAKDNCGNKTTCEQKIYTQSRSDFEVIFPADVTLNCKEISNSKLLDPGDGSMTGNIMIMDDECELVGVNHDDVRYDIVEDGCYKIVRTWTLTDWCKYDPLQHDRQTEVIVNDTLVANKDGRACVYRNLKDDGDGYITYTQIIKVIDEIAPVLNCKDTILCTYVDNCVEQFQFNFSASDNCTPADQIAFRWELIPFGSTVVSKRSIPNVKGFNEVLSAGNYTLVVYASDKCGNEDTCEMKLMVKDCKKPTPYCLNGIATVLMPSTGALTIWARDFNAGAYDNCTPKDKLKYYFGNADCSAPGDTGKTFDCKSLGTNLLCIWVVDEAGNADKCETYVLIQDNNTPPICSQPNISSIQGGISTESGAAVQGVKVKLKSGNDLSTDATTGNGGKFAFTRVVDNSNFTLVPAKNDDWMNGVSTIDLMLIQQHVLGVKPLSSMYKIIAADVNHNEAVEAVDMLELRKLILGIYNELPNNTSWRFAEKSTLNPKTPFIINEQIQKPGLQLPKSINDFMGIKIGDVNETVVAHQLLGAEARSSKSEIVLESEDIKLQPGKVIEIPLKLKKSGSLAGFQFTFGFDFNELEFVGFRSGSIKLDESNFAYNQLKKGLLPLSWFDLNTTSFLANEVLFTLQFKTKSNALLSQLIQINSKITRAEAYASDHDDFAKNIRLNITSQAIENKGMLVYQNAPNPFSSFTSIGFDLPNNLSVKIAIIDLTGKVVKNIKGDYQKGYNQIKITNEDLPSPGVYYYQVSAGEYRISKKLVLVE